MTLLFQGHRVVFISVEFENILPPAMNALVLNGYDAQDKFLRPVGKLQQSVVLGILSDNIAVYVGDDRPEFHKGGR